ncbi:copper homeostasis protein (lipoprotein) [Cyclobacterium xiamenense]|jgi:copper homeostasis protein (lipoprotein)|uniref:Copper homeostasis protein (Lipoprotein) n=1 Tax=Cyclobacterium xiamenense TaxID=1297121 RepID=A0A1H7AZ55_9BACT|nr:copper resistance protein NlpE N-terminal domain-containing protein [Cyclobacterium xiamenense]SEJ67432.1 copper homeostasis protein (lipoprotein) [Cyclobacterium xiamenense]
MKKQRLITLFVLAVLFSCDAPTEEKRYEGAEQEGAAEQEELVLDNTFSTWMQYEGLLPCADCKGIQTVLKLENSPNKKERSYELTETYQGTKDGDREYVRSGIYEVVYGLENDPGAMAIRLLDDSGAALKSFLQDKEGMLHLLDTNEKNISAEGTYTLELVKQ